MTPEMGGRATDTAARQPSPTSAAGTAGSAGGSTAGRPAAPVTPTLTLQLPTSAVYGRWLTKDPLRLIEIARAAEAAGVDRLAAVDHVVMGSDNSQYRWANMTVPQTSPWLEPLTVLMAIAMATSTIRLSTRILVAPLRPATLLAKQVATLDVLSGGRVDLGVGTGWQREEYESQGIDFATRGQALTDTIAACRALWSGEPTSFESDTVSFDQVCSSPAPAQDRLPVWFGGTMHKRNLGRIVQLGDGWIPIMQASAQSVAEGVEQLRAAGIDRPLSVQGELPVERRDDFQGDVDATLAHVPQMLEAGATDIFLSIASMSPDANRATQVVEEVATRFEEYR